MGATQEASRGPKATTLWSLVARGYLAVEGGLAAIAAAIVAAMMSITVLDVFLRSWFNTPLMGAFELMEFMMGGVVFLGLAYVQRARGHLAIELLTARFPRAARQAVQILGSLVALVLFLAIAWESSRLAYRAWEIQDYTMGAASLPMWPARSAVAVGSIVFCIRLVVDAVCDLGALIGNAPRD
ncbi:MAG: TRAP transporter small permease [Candidatus Rokubacteria bacterium]|nr:TRAP transporter small permease [Candidatus Rokubacteria bacterium]